MIYEMPICEHRIPFRLECKACGRLPSGSKVVDYDLYNKVTALTARFDYLEKALHNALRLERQAVDVIDLLAAKAHDLKKTDSKRDEVINLLNQKISALESQIREINYANSRR